MNKKEQITFYNEEPPECGCTVEFSDGYGIYSDCMTVTLCKEHKKKKKKK